MKYTSIRTGRLISMKPEITVQPYVKDGHCVPSIVITSLGNLYTTKKLPGIATLERYSNDCVAKTPCGCRVEPDGECCHGIPSWMIIAGVI